MGADLMMQERFDTVFREMGPFGNQKIPSRDHRTGDDIFAQLHPGLKRWIAFSVEIELRFGQAGKCLCRNGIGVTVRSDVLEIFGRHQGEHLPCRLQQALFDRAVCLDTSVQKVGGSRSPSIVSFLSSSSLFSLKRCSSVGSSIFSTGIA